MRRDLFVSYISFYQLNLLKHFLLPEIKKHEQLENGANYLATVELLFDIGWIDFEKEISTVIHSFQEFLKSDN